MTVDIKSKYFPEDDILRGVFVKFGEEEHLRKLKAGSLHCKNLQYFAGLDDGGRRGDKNEIVTTFMSGNLQLEIIDPTNPDKVHKFKMESARFSANVQPVNLFCLYTVDISKHIPDTIIPLDTSFKSWSSHFIVITHIKNFVERVIAAAKKNNYRLKYGDVKYKDLTKCNEPNNGFIKDIMYQYQKEFRFRFETDKVEDIDLSIGDISDITSPIYSIKDLENFPMKYQVY